MNSASSCIAVDEFADDCPVCGGTGRKYVRVSPTASAGGSVPGYTDYEERSCPACGGSGKAPSKPDAAGAGPEAA